MFPFGLWKKDEVSSSEEVVEVNQVAEVCPNEEVAEVCTNEEVTIDVVKAEARGLASAQKRLDRQLNSNLISLLSAIEKALEKEYGSIAQCPERIEKRIEERVELQTKKSGVCRRKHLVLLTIDTSSLGSLAGLVGSIDKVDLSEYPRFCMIRKSPNIGFCAYDDARVSLEINPSEAFPDKHRQRTF